MPNDPVVAGAPGARDRRLPPVLPRRPRAMLLDAGNTLLQIRYDVLAEIIDSHRQTQATEAALPENLRRAEWRARARLDAEVARGSASIETPITLRRYLVLILEEARADLSGEARERVIEEIEDFHASQNLWSRPHPYARRVLEDLRALDLKLAVVSNSDGRVEELLAEAGLADLLDDTFDSALVGAEKPDPRIFEAALESLGVAAAAAVHVGDLVSVDVVGARAAGMTPVLVDPAGLWPEVEAVRIRDITALPELVRRAPVPVRED